jgi:hypothetical protein
MHKRASPLKEAKCAEGMPAFIREQGMGSGAMSSIRSLKNKEKEIYLHHFVAARDMITHKVKVNERKLGNAQWALEMLIEYSNFVLHLSDNLL